MSNEITVFNNDNEIDLKLSNSEMKNDKIYGSEFWMENYKILFTFTQQLSRKCKKSFQAEHCKELLKACYLKVL